MKITDSAPVPAKLDGGLFASWWPRLWPALLVLLTVIFIALALPPYLTFDASRSRIPPPADIPAYYPLLVMHIGFASIAMLAGSLQIWTGLQRRYLTAHRLIGRVYVFAGVLPAGIVGRAIGSISPFGPVLRASNIVLATLWLTCTVIGFRMGRRRRFEQHRRWMIRSFVLTLSIITNRVWAAIFASALAPQLFTTFGGNELLLVQTIAGLSGWLGWVLPLLVVEWWLLERVERNTSARTAPLQVKTH
jgi:uncharacterized membrane protein YozB (DUF420 family)